MASLRRSIKNAILKYAPCEIDVREATSNEAAPASPVVLMRIADATSDLTQSPMVMRLLWKRMGERDKFWRHVYKALILLEYLLRCGAPHIVDEVQANVFAVQLLRDFEFVDVDDCDVGVNVRERAKAVLKLLDAPTLLVTLRAAACSVQAQQAAAVGADAMAQHLIVRKESRKRMHAATRALALDGASAPMAQSPAASESADNDPYSHLSFADEAQASSYAPTPRTPSMASCALLLYDDVPSPRHHHPVSPRRAAPAQSPAGASHMHALSPADSQNNPFF